MSRTSSLENEYCSSVAHMSHRAWINYPLWTVTAWWLKHLPDILSRENVPVLRTTDDIYLSFIYPFLQHWGPNCWFLVMFLIQSLTMSEKAKSNCFTFWGPVSNYFEEKSHAFCCCERHGWCYTTEEIRCPLTFVLLYSTIGDGVDGE